ncbi:hypothetical protein PoB_003004100 [Plakobranchus ocellatus]|uniref:Uncharacterized protein n=1 Tax=Plakobranchus ocellatus TaxID=259542 RepID=A0AAV3ZX59_9GAST|nr:hypothetical protein PoB_003004100 [Plakobranchus ocellatus]
MYLAYRLHVSSELSKPLPPSLSSCWLKPKPLFYVPGLLPAASRAMASISIQPCPIERMSDPRSLPPCLWDVASTSVQLLLISFRFDRTIVHMPGMLPPL